MWDVLSCVGRLATTAAILVSKGFGLWGVACRCPLPPRARSLPALAFACFLRKAPGLFPALRRRRSVPPCAGAWGCKNDLENPEGLVRRSDFFPAGALFLLPRRRLGHGEVEGGRNGLGRGGKRKWPTVVPSATGSMGGGRLREAAQGYGPMVSACMMARPITSTTCGTTALP